MKIFLVYFAFAGFAFTSGWILYEKSSPLPSTPSLIRKPARRLPGLNLTRGRNTQTRSMRRLERRNETPRLCHYKEKCNQIYYRNRFAYKTLFEAAPPFMGDYDNLSFRRLKGGQTLQVRGGYLGRNNVYMTPDLMIVQPLSSSYAWLPPRTSARQDFREILIASASKARESQPGSRKIGSAALFQPSSESKLSNKETSPFTKENLRAFTEVSPQDREISSTTKTSLSTHLFRPASIRPYAVKEIVDEDQPSEDDGIIRMSNKPLFVPNFKKETLAGVRSRTSANSRVVKITPVSERNETVEKIFRKAPYNSYPTTTDHFIQIIPIHRSRGISNKRKERPVNRKEQTKNLKAVNNWMQNQTAVLAENRSGNRINSTLASWLEYQQYKTIETTPSAITDPVPKHILTEVEITGVEQKESHAPMTERELKKNFSKTESQTVTPLEINSTLNEVTFLIREFVNVTDVPEKFSVTWETPEGVTPTAQEILNTIGYITSRNSTTPETLTTPTFRYDFPTTKAEGKKDQEPFWKNSRKMHFNQESHPNDVLDAIDQRRSDILITDNFDEDYLDEEYGLGYLEKLRRRNNSLESGRNLTSDSLIPLIPEIIQGLREGKIPPEDISLLSEAFGDRWATVLELSNTTNLDMLPLLKMKDETDLENILQSVLPSSEPTTTQTAVTDVDYESYDYLEKFKDLYEEDFLTVGQELQGDAEKRFEKRVKGWKRSGNTSDT